MGKTPYRSDRMTIKKYHVRIDKNTYFPIDTVLIVGAGETIRPTFHMKSKIKPKEPRKMLIMAQGGIHPSQTAFGGMIGFMRNNGVYAAFRSDFGSVNTKG